MWVAVEVGFVAVALVLFWTTFQEGFIAWYGAVEPGPKWWLLALRLVAFGFAIVAIVATWIADRRG